MRDTGSAGENVGSCVTVMLRTDETVPMTFVAVRVIGYTPVCVGVPENVAVDGVNVTPGIEPVRLIVGVGVPVTPKE